MSGGLGLAGKESERLFGPSREVPQGAGDGGAWLGDHPAQQADDPVAHGGQDPGSVAFSDLRAVFVESDIAHPMEAILDGPVATIECPQLAVMDSCT